MPYKDKEKQKISRDNWRSKNIDLIRYKDRLRDHTESRIIKNKIYNKSEIGLKNNLKSKYKAQEIDKDYQLKKDVRKKTRSLYPPLPRGMEYHHPDYSKGWMFQILTTKKHKKIHRRYQEE
jgi:hypothetical protein